MLFDGLLVCQITANAWTDSEKMLNLTSSVHLVGRATLYPYYLCVFVNGVQLKAQSGTVQPASVGLL